MAYAFFRKCDEVQILGNDYNKSELFCRGNYNGLNSGNVFYHSVRNPLCKSERLQFTKLEFYPLFYRSTDGKLGLTLRENNTH
jgi:hypothetical protein